MHPRSITSALALAACAPFITGQDAIRADVAGGMVPAGYRLDIAHRDLTNPTSVAFDDAGNLYVAEAGAIGTGSTAIPRILRAVPGGPLEVFLTEGLLTPVNDLLFHEGEIYVSHGTKVSVAGQDRVLRDLVTDLPSLGDHGTGQLAAGPDGKIYFGQGTATNSGVVGVDNFVMGWLEKNPEVHDVPAQPIKIQGVAFESEDRPRGSRQRRTSPFSPFGQTRSAGTVEGRVKANGTILRMDPDGGNLEVHAWGLRNPFGIAFAPDGTLFAADHGMDERGSRPVADAPDNLYVIEPGAFYGWPDFASGIPIDDPRFRPAGRPAPAPICDGLPRAEMPFLTFPVHAGVAKLAIAPESFGPGGSLFVAVFGPMVPLTGAQRPASGTFQVTRIDLEERQVTPFLQRRESLPAVRAGPVPKPDRPVEVRAREEVPDPSAAGPRRPIDVAFSTDGVLHVADFGLMETGMESYRTIPGSGVIWRVTRVAPAAGDGK